jgi:uncharacterized protein DUF6788
MPAAKKKLGPLRADSVLQRYEAQFRGLRAQLADLGFFCKGTLLEHRLTCGKPNCVCAQHPERRHGPYFDWTYKVAGKTVGVRLRPDVVADYRAAIAEWRRLRTLLGRLESLSRRALKRKERLQR